MNLPLYSPTAPAAGRNPGYETYGLAVHCQTAPYQPPPSSGSPGARSDGLPLGLRRQAGARPPGEGVGLVPADVDDRRGGVHRLQAVESERLPFATAALPVQRRLPAVRLDRGPAVGHPQIRAPVPSVGHEGLPVTAGDGRSGDPERAQQHVVAGPLVVEREAIAIVPDLDDPAVVVDPPGSGHRRAVAPWQCAVRRAQRVAREGVVDVHDQQLLVLLLVVQAQLEQLGRSLVRTAVDDLQNGGVDVLAVLGDLRDAWAGDQPALGSGVTGADGLVVGVEQEAEALVVRRVLGVRARRSRRTTSCGRGATWWDWRRASTARSGPRR